MVSVKADPARNRLDLVVAQPYSMDEASRVPEMLKQESAKLQPGWIAAIDLSRAGILDQDNTHLTRGAQEALKALGCGRIATLMAGAVQHLQIKRLAAEVGSDSLAQRFTDRAEWEAFLAAA